MSKLALDTAARPEGVGVEVLFEVIDRHIAVVTLNRPEKRNAVNGRLTEALGWLVGRIEADVELRAAILTSSNDRAFCSGADLAEISAGRAGSLSTRDGGFAGFANATRAKPWIAAISGSALGGGCELALACDMVVASTTAGFGLPEVKRGLFAGAGGVHRLPRQLPRNLALELIATGDPLPARRGYELGLVNRLAEPEAVLETALELARTIAANAPLSVQQSLWVARQCQDHPDEVMRSISMAAALPVLTSADSREGPLAFLEKRPPRWQGR